MTGHDLSLWEWHEIRARNHRRGRRACREGRSARGVEKGGEILDKFLFVITHEEMAAVESFNRHLPGTLDAPGGQGVAFDVVLSPSQYKDARVQRSGRAR